MGIHNKLTCVVTTDKKKTHTYPTDVPGTKTDEQAITNMLGSAKTLHPDWKAITITLANED